MSEKTEGIAILFLSDYKGAYQGDDKEERDPKKDVKNYEFINGESKQNYRGLQTNDAPIKCLIDIAKKDNNPITKIYCIVSKKVYKNSIKENRHEEDEYKEVGTAFERFKMLVKDVNNEYGDSSIDIQIIPIYYDMDENGSELEDKNKLAVHIYEQLDREFKQFGLDKKIAAYIDYTGGLRDVNFLMTSIIRYMQFRNIEMKKIVYSSLKDDKIFEINYIYDMYELINGVSEFVNTGNARQLKLLYDKSGLLADNKVTKVIDAINNFSEIISLCSIAQIDNAYKNLFDAIEEFENDKEKYADDNNIYVHIFQTLIPLIKEKMLLENIDKEYLIYPQLIKWCVKNGMLQQALTIYTEKMPIYYFNADATKWINNIVNLDEIKPGNNSKEATGFYTNFYDNYNDDKKLKNDIVNAVEDYLNNAKQDPDKNCPEEFKKIIKELSNTMVPNSKGKTICDKILEDIESYDRDGKKATNKKCLNIVNNVPKTLEGYINLLKAGKFNIMKILKKEDSTSKSEKEQKELTTYQTKINCIESFKNEEIKNINDNIKNKNQQINQEQKDKMVDRMTYYLAVKFIRNQVNHASNKDSNDEKIALNYIVNYMKKYNINIQDSIVYDNVKQILLNGIKLESNS